VSVTFLPVIVSSCPKSVSQKIIAIPKTTIIREMPANTAKMRASGGHRFVPYAKSVTGTAISSGVTESTDLPASSKNGQTSTLTRAKDRIQMLCFEFRSTQPLIKNKYACAELKAFFEPNMPIIAHAPAFHANFPTANPTTSAAKNAHISADISKNGSVVPAMTNATAIVNVSSIAYLDEKSGASDQKIERTANPKKSQGSQSRNNALSALFGKNKAKNAAASKNTTAANV
jgi:hypothetical protein